MSEFLTRLEQRFKAHLNGELEKIIIPNYDERGDLVAYFRPGSMTGDQAQKVAAAQNRGDAIEGTVLMMIYMLVDENEERLFRRSNLTQLMNSVAMEDLAKLALQMNSAEDLSEEDIEKN